MRNSPPPSIKDEAPPSPQAIQALTALLTQGEFARCEEQARAMTSQFAGHPFGWSVLGVCLAQMGRFSEAIAPTQTAISLQPSNAGLATNLGNILNNLGRFEEAGACFRHVLALNPDDVMAHNNLGVALDNMGRLSEAEACFRRALELKHDFAHTYINLGSTLKDLGRLSEAETCVRLALRLQPNFSQAHGILGLVLDRLGRPTEAEVCFRRALVLQPDYAQAHSSLLFIQNYRSDAASAAFDEARRYGQSVNGLATRVYADWLCETKPLRLRVGLVSGDFCDHVVSYFLESLLSEINHARIEIIAYPTQLNEDRISQRLRLHVDAWHPLFGLPDAAAAARIHADGVHVLLDMSGHTAHNRLPIFAYKPAPVQASWLGYFATTGVTTMDYLIADPWTMPETEEVYFTEKIWRLPETRLCFTPPDVLVQVGPLPALTNGYITFGCFNNLTKINAGVVALWSRVLKAVPGSRLFLKAKQFQGASSARDNIVERFAAHDISGDRLILEAAAPREEYLLAYQRMDIALDPFPYPGGTTSAEGLWMGVPVLTLAGECFLSRQGVGLLMNTGLPEWVASTPDDYVARAVSNAGDLQGLAALRAVLRDRFLASPVCDAKRFARHFEQALEDMWQARGG